MTARELNRRHAWSLFEALQPPRHANTKRTTKVLGNSECERPRSVKLNAIWRTVRAVSALAGFVDRGESEVVSDIGILWRRR